MTEASRAGDVWQDAEGVDDAQTVRDRILAQTDSEDVHGLVLTAQVGTTVYGVLAHSTTADAGDVLDLRTVVVDRAEETVKVSDNGLWVPRSPAVLDAMTSLVARATTDCSTGRTADADPLTLSTVETDADALLATEVADDYERDDEQDYTRAPPEAIDGLISRLLDAGIGTSERFNRLQFGQKQPFDHTLVGRDGLYGNYGVYATADDPLVLVDVDDPDALDVELPATYTVTSPHGSDERAHHYYRVDGYDEVVEAAGGVANFAPSWGDVRTQNQYVVGPGSQLDGCDKDGCTACATDEGGRYEVVDDRPIASLDAAWLLDVLEADPAVDLASDDEGERRDPVTTDEREAADDVVDDAQEDSEDAAESVAGEHVECYLCGREVAKAAATVFASDDERTVWQCMGGCDR